MAARRWGQPAGRTAPQLAPPWWGQCKERRGEDWAGSEGGALSSPCKHVAAGNRAMPACRPRSSNGSSSSRQCRDACSPGLKRFAASPLQPTTSAGGGHAQTRAPALQAAAGAEAAAARPAPGCADSYAGEPETATGGIGKGSQVVKAGIGAGRLPLPFCVASLLPSTWPQSNPTLT